MPGDRIRTRCRTITRQTFEDSSTADRVLNELRATETEYVPDFEDAVIVVHDTSGKVHLKQCADVLGGATTHSGTLGVLWDGLIGLLFLNLPAGLLDSIAGGVGAGAMTTTTSEHGLLLLWGYQAPEHASLRFLCADSLSFPTIFERFCLPPV